MDEQAAIQRLKKGDISGLEALVALHQLKALRTAYLITGDAEVAQDLVQDCFIRAFHAIRRFDPSRPFEPWFLRSVVNSALKMRQKYSHESQAADSPDDQALEKLEAILEPLEAQIETRELQANIWEALQQLSPRQRAVIIQRYYLEMSEREMAEQSGTAEGTVKWLLNAARSRLKPILAERNKP